MSSARLHRETEGTEVITPRLDHHVFASEELPPGDLPQGSELRLHHLLFLLGRHTVVIWILWQYLYGITIRSEFTIYFVKSRVHHTISDIATTREVELFGGLDFWQYTLRVLDPLRLCLVGDDT